MHGCALDGPAEGVARYASLVNLEAAAFHQSAREGGVELFQFQTVK